MVPRIEIDRETECDAIIANENRLRSDRNLLGDERERYRTNVMYLSRRLGHRRAGSEIDQGGERFACPGRESGYGVR